jgi:hypothetical protein
VLAFALALAVSFHIALPDIPYYQGLPVYLEGPFPFIIGAALGVWFHRAEARWFRWLGVCGYGVAFTVAAILLLGSVVSGPGYAFKSTYNLLVSSIATVPFSVLPEAWGTTFFLYLVWTSLRSLVIWGALAYGIALLNRPHTRARMRARFDDLRQKRAFERHQRQLHRDYREAYLSAVRAGQEPPPPPAGLLPAIAGPSGGYARTTFWTLRIVLLVGGLLWGWAMLDEYIYALARDIGMSLLFGG